MPDFRKIVRQRISALQLEAGAETNLTEEFAQHLEDLYQDWRKGGISGPEALRSAVAELDDLYPVQAHMRSQRMPVRDAVPVGDVSRGSFTMDLWRDLRYACRAMRKSPLVVTFVVLTLALGIGANTTVFTMINTLILNPLPVANPSRLASVATVEEKSTAKSGVALPISLPNLKDYQARNEVFSSLAGYTAARVVTYDAGGVSQRMFSELVTGNYFSTLGLTPSAGRFFSPDEDSVPGGHPVAVMNYATWQARFGGTGDILGKTLRLNSVVFTIIGVAPPSFIGVNAIFGPDLWIPAAMAEQLLPTEMHDVLSERSKALFAGVGRLKPGVSRQQADANFLALAASLAREYPHANEGRSAKVRPVTEAIFDTNGIGHGAVVFGSAVLLGIVGIVLLIACSNVSNLLLARAAARQGEMAVRLAMGAGRGRLMRQLLTESLLLGALSGLVGLLVGYEGSRLLWSFRPAEVATNFITPKMDATVFVFALVLSLFTSFLFGTIPALRSSRLSVAETLKEDARTSGRSRRKISVANALLVGQVAFSFVSLLTATLFLRSIERAYEIDTGFQSQHLAIVMTQPGQAGYGKPQTKAFYKQVREQVAGLPGVASASWSLNLPLWGRMVSGLEIEGHEQRSKSDIVTTFLNTVDVGYFQTAGVTVDRGRDFTEMDQETSTPVAIVNEKLAHDYWPGQQALGRHIQLPGENVMRQVVGVVRTANYSALGEPPQPCVYVPLEQKYSDSMVLFVRSQGDPQQVINPVERLVRSGWPQVSLNDARTGRTIVDQALFGPKLGVTMLSIFGMLALALASIGLYGLMAYSVHRRKREIGVRMALGAAPGSVLRLILKEGMSMVLAGIVIGLVAAMGVARLLARLLYGVSASDPMSVGGAALVLLVVALVACYLPARSASRMGPLDALRQG